MYSDFLMQQKR